jgi:tRNA-dihydrouridine synthase B
MLKIGKVILDVPYFLASLSGYSDYAMREIARQCGAAMTFAGVMLAKGIIHKRVIENRLFWPGEDEHPIGAQLLGEEPDIMAKAGKLVWKGGYDLVDLNFACPTPKVVNKKRGGFLLNQPDKVMEIYEAVREAVDCPVTMKLRAGFDSRLMDNFWEICTRAVEGKVDALIIHPRDVNQRFMGSANWEILSEVKKRFPKTIIIGSGDLYSAQIVKDNIKKTGVDGAAIARGAIGNPWIFRQLRDENYKGPTIEEQGEIITRHFQMLRPLYGDKKSVMHFRKFAIAYCKLHPQRKKVQKELVAAKTAEELLALVKEWYKS